MRYYAQINELNLCQVISETNGQIDGVIDVAAEVQSGTPLSDFLWRKYENGAWSVEKFEPPVNTGPSEIDQIKFRLAATEQAAADNSLTTQQLLETLIDLGVI